MNLYFSRSLANEIDAIIIIKEKKRYLILSTKKDGEEKRKMVGMIERARRREGVNGSLISKRKKWDD